MQSEDQFDDMDIVFAENDTAGETLRAADYLLTQLAAMNDHGGLTDEERKLNRQAQQALGDLKDALAERHREQIFENANLDAIAAHLDRVHDLSIDIYRELDDVSDTINATGWPEPNPHSVANEHADSTDRHARTLRNLTSDDEGELGDDE